MTAKIITIFNQKGGCGKTTVSVHLAGTIAMRGSRVLLVDMDDQSTATKWISEASDDKPFPASLINLAAMGGKMHREINNQIKNYDYIIIDCPPAIQSPAPSSAMLISDLAVIPVVPSPADMWAAMAAKQLALSAQVTNEGLKVVLLPNMVQSNTKIARDALEVLSEDDEVPLLKSTLGTRSAFRECQLEGGTVHLIPKATKAIAEVDALVDEILSII